MRLIIVVALLSALLSPTRAEAVETACVQIHTEKFWAVGHAAMVWNEVDAGQPKFQIRDECPYEAVHVYSSWRWKWKWAGMTHYGEGDRVVIRMNDAIPKRSSLTPRQARRWKRFAMTHEFGHVLNLNHSEVKGSVMCYCTNGIRNNGTLHWTDRQTLRALY